MNERLVLIIITQVCMLPRILSNSYNERYFLWQEDTIAEGRALEEQLFTFEHGDLPRTLLFDSAKAPGTPVHLNAPRALAHV